MRSTVFPGAIVPLLVVSAACSSFSSGGADAGTAGDVDAASLDGDGSREASVGLDGGDAAVAGNILANGDFTDGCAGGWTPGYAELTAIDDVAIAHSPTKTCRVCAKSGNTDWSLYQDAPAGSVIGDKFRVDAWVRSAPGAQVPNKLSARIDVDAQNSDVLQYGPPSTASTLDAGWQPLSVRVTVAKAGGAQLRFTLSAEGSGTCFLVDDAVLVRD